jgi:hypothetical protein
MPANHAYFFANLPLFAVVCAILILGRRRPAGRLALHSRLACLPCSLLALMHGDYWRPGRLGGAPIGVEDLIFTFTTGAAVWLWAAWGCGGDFSVPSPLPAGRATRRLLSWGLASGSLLAALWRAGLDPMSATLLAPIPVLAFLLTRQPRLWILAGTGLVCFVPVYYAGVKLEFAIFPGYPSQWNPHGPWTPPFLGLPAGELAWAAVFAVLWPVLIASAFEVDVGAAGAAVPSAGD